MRDSEFLSRLGKRIRQIREKKNLTQTKIASKCSFAKANLSRIEAGQTNVSVLTLKKISKALGVEVGELFE